MANLDDLMKLGDPDDIRAEIRGLRAALATERAAREEAEKLAVWAVRNYAYFEHGEFSFAQRDGRRWDRNDGTDAGILAALRRAMEGSSDGVS